MSFNMEQISHYTSSPQYRDLLQSITAKYLQRLLDETENSQSFREGFFGFATQLYKNRDQEKSSVFLYLLLSIFN